MHQQHQCTSIINSISSSNALAASVHQCISSISSISASAASAHQHHQCMGYRHRKRYLPIYIKTGHISQHPLTPPELLQTPSDTIKHGPYYTRYHKKCIMFGLYGLKHHIVERRIDVTDAGRQLTNKRRWNLSAKGCWMAENKRRRGVLREPEFLTIPLKIKTLDTGQQKCNPSSCFQVS